MKLFEPSRFLRQVKETAVSRPIILYGAGMDAVWAIEEWRKNFGVSFQGCICDGDPQKQGKIMDGVNILSPETALDQFPEAMIWVSAKDYKFEIMGHLLYEKKIPDTKILNFEPVVYKRGCRYAEKMFFAFEGNNPTGGQNRIIRICDDTEQQAPVLLFDGYHDFQYTFSQFRDHITEALDSDSGYPGCKECQGLKTSYYAVDQKIRTYNLATDGICNFKCCYCYAPIFSKEQTVETFDFMRALEIFAENNMLAEDLHMDITSGEICVNPHRAQMLEAASRYAETVSIATNASIFDQQMYKVLESGRASLIVSVDAGTPETFARIKQRNMYDKVKNNLIEYGKAGVGAVELKYIVLPDINDNPEDIDGFVDLCQEVNPAIVTISFDFYYRENVKPKTLDMINRLKKQLSDKGFFYKYEARAAHFLKLSDEV